MFFIERNGYAQPVRSQEDCEYVSRINAILGDHAVEMINAAEAAGVTVRYMTTDMDYSMAVTTDIFDAPVMAINCHLYLAIEKMLVGASKASRQRVAYRIIETVAHELHHVAQHRSGRLGYNDAGQTTWEGEVWCSEKREMVGYINQIGRASCRERV